MLIIEISTLVDITNTKVLRPNQGTQLEIDQNRNFITLKQCAEIRSVISFDSKPTVETRDLKGLGFGSAYTGKHRVWTFTFIPDRADAYTDAELNPLGELSNDFTGIPIIKNLTETVNISKAMFDCKDNVVKNIIFKALQGTI
jgi:hypothetical protein